MKKKSEPYIPPYKVSGKAMNLNCRGTDPATLCAAGGGAAAAAVAGGLPAGARIVCQKNLPTVIYLK